MLKVNNMIEVSNAIEKKVKDKELTYLEAAVEYFTEVGLEMNSAKCKNLLSPVIVEKIADEAYSMHMMGKNARRPNKLPID